MSWTLSGFCDEASINFGDQIAIAKQVGLSHLDVRIVNGRNIADLETAEVAPLADALRAANLRVGCLGSAIGKTDITDDFAVDKARLDRLAKHADALECRLVRVFSNFNQTGKKTAEWRQIAHKRLDILARKAKALGLTLLIENERHLYGDHLPEMLDLAASSGLGLIFDFDNFHQSGDDPWTNWLRLKAFTKAFHLKDSNNDCVHVPLGSGSCKVREILTDAKQSKWDGLLSLEPHLARSAAVVATGPHGRGSQESHDPVEAFLLGARTSQNLLKSIGIHHH